MSSARTPKVDVAAAEQCGRMAFRAGQVRAPACDKVYCDEILAKYTEGVVFGSAEHREVHPVVMQIGVSWLRGFDREMLAAPVDL